MEIRNILPEDVKNVATNNALSIPADEIDATFKSQYTGTNLILSILFYTEADTPQRSHIRASWFKSPFL